MPDTVLTIKGKNLTKEAIAQLKADIEKTTKALHDQAGANVKVADSTKKTAHSYTGLAIALGATSAALGLLTKNIANAAMTQQKLMMGLGSVEGSANGATQAMKRLIEVAKLPGLTLQQATQGYINLRAIDMNAQLAERSLKAFGNALVTVGKGAPELNMVILALTQMSAKGKVLGQDLRQLQEQLPQIRKVMKHAFGTADLDAIQKKMEETGQTADDFIRIIVTEFEKLPKISGFAANAVENFGDTLWRLKAAIGEGLLPYIIKLLDALSAIAVKFTELPKPIRDTIGMGIVGGAGLTSLAFILVGLHKAIPLLATDIKALSVAFTGLNASSGLLAAGLGAVALKIGAITAAFYAGYKIGDAYNKMIDRYVKYPELHKKPGAFLHELRKPLVKQMTRADYQPGDYIDAFVYDKARNLGFDLDQLTKADELLARIDNQIARINGTLKETQGLEFTESIRKGMLDFEDLKQQFEDLTALGELGFEWSPEQRLDWWTSQIFGEFVPSVTEKAKIGIKQMIKQYSDEVAKQAEKEQDRIKKEKAEFWRKWFDIESQYPLLDLTPRMRTPEHKEPFIIPAKEGIILPEAFAEAQKIREAVDPIGEAIRRIREQYQELYEYADKYGFDKAILEKQEAQKIIEFFGPIGSSINEIKEQYQKAYEYMAEYEISDVMLRQDEAERIIALQNEIADNWAIMAGKREEAELIRQQQIRERGDVFIEGMTPEEIEAAWKFRTELEEKAHKESMKRVEETMKRAEEYRDRQMAIWEDLAYSLSDVFARIPAELITNFDNVESIIKNFAKNILNVLANMAGQIIGEKIFGALVSVFGTMIAPGILPTMTSGVAMGADFIMSGLTFDDPYNDMMAYKSGERSGIAMTRKSSMDFINNFESGFTKSSEKQMGEGGLGNKLDKLIGLMENTKYEFYLDSDPIASKVRKKTNKKVNRGEWAE